MNFKNSEISPACVASKAKLAGKSGTEGTDLREICSLLSDMIRIPSVNSVNTGNSSEDRKGEAEKLSEISELVRTWFEDRGVSARIIEFDNEYPTVIAEAGKGSKTVLLNGHMDVVPVGDLRKWRSDPFSGRISSGYVFGRGASDMKGGLAVQMHAMTKMADETDCRLIFAAVPDEETGGQHGARHVSARYRPDIVLIAEPTESMVSLGERGTLNLDIVALGKAAHASRPSLGINAIMLMADKLKLLSEITKTPVHAPGGMKKVLDDTELAFGNKDAGITFNPGTITGGVKSNVVPDRCEVVVNLRFPVGISSAETFDIVNC